MIAGEPREAGVADSRPAPRAPSRLLKRSRSAADYAAWALGSIGTEAAPQVLRRRRELEEDACVREEGAATLGAG